MERCFSQHRVKENRFGNQHFCARKLYINSVNSERQKRTSFCIAMNSMSTQIKRQENAEEQRMSERGNCLIEILRRTVRKLNSSFAYSCMIYHFI